VDEKSNSGEAFDELLKVMARLRGNNGCPWDKEQTHASLGAFLIEESYELLEALERGDSGEIREELGDLLHQIVFHCQIAAEQSAFTAADVVKELKEKMVRRHPHVFSGRALPNSDAVVKQWARLKAGEKYGEAPRSVLGNLPKSMPALARAQTITERASQLGFDWPGIEPVWQKIDEELDELKEACATGTREHIANELGDLLFSLVNLSRFLDLQAENVLAHTVSRFIHRFTYIERELREKGKSLTATSLEEMDRLWNEAKALEPRGKSRA
jgi:tetrapyrrole methylase family protein/MazG family protein